MQEQVKVDWILKRLPAMIDSGEVLIFANQIIRVEEVCEKIKSAGHRLSFMLLDLPHHGRT